MDDFMTTITVALIKLPSAIEELKAAQQGQHKVTAEHQNAIASLRQCKDKFVNHVNGIEAKLSSNNIESHELRAKQKQLSQEINHISGNYQALAASVEDLARSTPVFRPAPDGRGLVLGLSASQIQQPQGLRAQDLNINEAAAMPPPPPPRPRLPAFERESSMVSTSTLVGDDHVSNIALPVRELTRVQSARLGQNMAMKRKRSSNGSATEDRAVATSRAVDYAKRRMARDITDQQMLDVAHGDTPPSKTSDVSDTKRSRNAKFVPEDGVHKFSAVVAQGTVVDQNNGFPLLDMESEGEDVAVAPRKIAPQSLLQQSSIRLLHGSGNAMRRSPESVPRRLEVQTASSSPPSSLSDEASPKAARVSIPLTSTNRAEALLARFQVRGGGSEKGHAEVAQDESSDESIIFKKNWRSKRERRPTLKKQAQARWETLGGHLLFGCE
ncbi:hypothetical protein EJ03DRAFT_374867 [Teratosphaeria nubilosa]|uniref:Uncharacterized protein n=1 Tax=Teratosphaeria nubilosa TaxID=161662 RepID=A0A6G1L8Z4_9PEZI|nr:hypothetical protein EJ03DRAFT_374867 [Teratosphaeria nubilosa]